MKKNLLIGLLIIFISSSLAFSDLFIVKFRNYLLKDGKLDKKLTTVSAFLIKELLDAKAVVIGYGKVYYQLGDSREFLKFISFVKREKQLLTTDKVLLVYKGFYLFIDGWGISKEEEKSLNLKLLLYALIFLIFISILYYYFLNYRKRIFDDTRNLNQYFPKFEVDSKQVFLDLKLSLLSRLWHELNNNLFNMEEKEKIINLLKQLRSFSNPVKLEEVNVKEVLNEVLVSIDEKFTENKDFKLDLRVEELKTDAGKFLLILRNLLRNAFEYSKTYVEIYMDEKMLVVKNDKDLSSVDKSKHQGLGLKMVECLIRELNYKMEIKDLESEFEIKIYFRKGESDIGG